MARFDYILVGGKIGFPKPWKPSGIEHPVDDENGVGPGLLDILVFEEQVFCISQDATDDEIKDLEYILGELLEELPYTAKDMYIIEVDRLERGVPYVFQRYYMDTLENHYKIYAGKMAAVKRSLDMHVDFDED